MRAIIIKEHGRPEDMVIEHKAVPVPGPGQMLVEARAIGVNYPDLLVIGGTYQTLAALPFSPGKDLSGVVRAVGPGVSGVEPGERVLCQMEYGAYAEQVVVDEASCLRIPDQMPFEDAAAMGLVYQTAYFALVERGLYRAGETVLVNGAAGGVGLAAVQIAKGLGATVLAGVLTGAQAAVARDGGADHVVDLSVPNLHDALRDQVRALTDGRGADIVLDPIGGDVFDAALRSLAWRGRMVVIGFISGRIPQIRANYLLVKNIQVSGLQWSDYRERDPERVRRVQSMLFDLYQAGRVRPRVMRTFRFEDFAHALGLVRDGAVTGKVVLTV